jgi:hypothetical protein
MKTRMTSDEMTYEQRKKLYFDTLYPILKRENLTKDQIGKINNKISELIIHLIDNHAT